MRVKNHMCGNATYQALKPWADGRSKWNPCWCRISSSDIILVDLTGVRLNVCVEAGFAFIFQPIEAHKSVPFDLNTFRYEPFKDTGEIPNKINPHITAILSGAAFGA